MIMKSGLRKKKRKVGFIWNLVNFILIVSWELVWKHILDNSTQIEFNGVDYSDFTRNFSYWALFLIGPAYYFFWVFYSLKHTQIGKPSCYDETLDRKWDVAQIYILLLMDFFIYIFIAAALFMTGPEVTTFADESCWWIGAVFTLLGILMIGWPFMLI